jgi:hypothetical protein
MELTLLIRNVNGHDEIFQVGAFYYKLTNEKKEALEKYFQDIGLLENGLLDGHSYRWAQFEEINTIEK